MSDSYTTPKGVPITLHSNKVFSVYFNGYYHYIEFNHCNSGAIVIPRFSNGDFLMVTLQRAPYFGQSTEFPRGGVEKHETPAAGAQRELLEETGHNVALDSFVKLGEFGCDTATLNGASTVFLANIAEDNTPIAFDAEEITSTARISKTEFIARVKSGLIVDGQTLAAFALLQIHEHV